MHSIIPALEWRYATKQYDTSKKLTGEQLDILLDAIRLAPTSLGLQPFNVINVTDPKLREELRAAAYGQPQVTDTSHFFVFAVPTNIHQIYV